EQKPTEELSGWQTWRTTIVGVLTSLGISATSFFTWFTGAITDPESKDFVLAISATLLVIAFLFGIVYLIIRAITTARKENHDHEIMMTELQLKSMPDRYNVKIDRRGDVTNLTAAGQPKPKE